MRVDKYTMAQSWMRQDDATPEEAEATWNTLETEFEDKRKAQLMASAETDEIIKTINDKFGPGTMFPASEAPIPPMTDQQAIFEFGQRNPKAGGGRIGFMSGLSAKTQNLVSLYDIAKLDLPIPEATIRQVFQTPDRAKAYKKIFKDNGIKIVATGKQRKALFKKPTQKQIDGVWKDTIKLVKEGKGTVPEKMRIPFKNEVLKIFNEFNQTSTPFSTSDIYYKLVENVQDNPRIFLPAKRKGGTRVPGEEIKRALGKEKADLLLDGNIQRIEKTIGNRKKLVEILSKGESDINTLAKTLNISKKDLFAEANILFDDVYRYNSHKVRKTGWGEKYGYLKDYEIKDFKNILNNLRASGFEKLDERSIRALITDAYAETSPKKYDTALKKLSQYNKINNELKEVFGFNFELDHPLSFQSLKNIGNVSPENLLRVTPIPKDINKIKIGLDGTYNNILSALRSGDTSPELLKQKKAIETIAKNLGIGEFKVSKTGDKILSFGAKPFLKTDLIGGMQENINLQNQIAKNLKNIDSNELEIAFGKKSKIPGSLKNLKQINTKQISDYITQLTGGDPKLNKFVMQNMAPSGLSGAYEMLSDDLKKIINSDGFKKFSNNSALKKTLAAGKLPTKLYGPLDFVLGFFDYQNNRQKGFSVGDSLAHAADMMLFGITDFGKDADVKGVKEIALKNGMSSEVFNGLVAANKNQNEVKQIITDFAAQNKDAKERIESGMADKVGESLILSKNQKDSQQRLKVLMAEAIEREPSLKTNLQVQEAGAPIDINVDKEKAFANLNKASAEFVQKRIDKSDLENIAKQDDTTMGKIGAYTKMTIGDPEWWLNFALKKPLKKTAAMKRIEGMDQLKREDPQLYYKMLLSEGVDPNRNMNIPVRLEFEMQNPEFRTPLSSYIKSQSYSTGGIAGVKKVDSDELREAQEKMKKLMKQYKNKDLDWDAVKRSYKIWTK